MTEELELKPFLRNRADYNPCDQITGQVVFDNPLPHSIKIEAYRTEIIQLMSKGIIDADLFETFYTRSKSIVNMLPDNTEIAIYSDLKSYATFCSERSLLIFPVKDDSLIAYIDRMMDEQKSKNTINRHITSLVWWCDTLGMDDPRKTWMMKLKLKKVRTMRRPSTARGQTEALRLEHLEQALEIFNPSIARDIQDVCLLFVGFETMCRRSELVNLKWYNFTEQSDGTGLMLIEFSKTDQEGSGRYQFVSENTTSLLMRWKEMQADASSNTPIFRGIYSNGKMGNALSPEGVNRSYKRIAARLGLDHSLFSGHSTRVGAAQEMLENNIHASKIMLSGRWKSMTMLNHYAQKINASKSGMAELSAITRKNREAAKGNIQAIEADVGPKLLID
jgi:integrase/recombinase XerD